MPSVTTRILAVHGTYLSADHKNLHSHPGIGVVSIIRAQIDILGHGGRPQSATTITPQVARRAEIFFLFNDVT